MHTQHGRAMAGGLIGSAVGDAVGEIAFRYERRETLRAEVNSRGVLEYTDDTAMMIGLAEALMETGGVTPEDIGAVFHRNFRREPGRGYGEGPPRIFAEVERTGERYRTVADRLFGGSGSYGNGAAMRVAPVGLVYGDREDLYDHVRASAVATHTHPLGIDGAAVQAKAVALAARTRRAEVSTAEFVAELVSFCRTDLFRRRLDEVAGALDHGMGDTEAAQTFGMGIAAAESVPFAIYSFLRFPKSYEKCFFCAALHSGDRDTVGAMAGAISGAHLGVEAIPKLWRKKLENSRSIEKLADGLSELVAG